MSEEKQLTVAEILARAQQENPEAGARRRRRRSLEEGGVSVAELTGSIKKVEARPVEAKHSSIPIDAPEPEATPAPEAAPVPEATPAPEATPVPAPQTQKPAPAPSTRIVTAKPTPKPVPSSKQEPEPKAEPRPVERKTEPRASEGETTVFKKVTAPAAAPEPAATPETEPVRVEAATQTHGGVEKQEPAAAAVETAPVAQRDDFDPFAENFSAAGDAAAVPAEEIVVEEATVNPIVLVLLVFLGVVLGVLGFLLFKWIWANTMAVVAALLGVAAVVGVVAGVGAMRHGRDALTMALAGLAAAVAAFGPALL